MTGAQAAIHFLGIHRVRRGPRDCYHAEMRTVYLGEETWGHVDIWSQLRALHEVAHYCQHINWPLLFSLRNFWPVRAFLEWEAWNKAERMLLMVAPEIETPPKRRRKSGYGKPRIFVGII